MRFPLRVAAVSLLLVLLAGVVITNVDKPASEISTQNISALRTSLQEQLREDGGARTYAAFKARYAGENFDTSHNAAHIMGELLFEENGVPGVAVCDTTFNFGCYHGFFTSAVAGKGLEVVTALDEACAKAAEGSSACQHGIGHGILEYLGHAQLEEALAACRLTNQPDPLAGCTGGVFMEYNVPLVARENGTYTIEARPLGASQDPYLPCPELSMPEFQRSCFQELPQWWKQVFTGGFEQMGAFCTKVSDARNKEACFGGIAKLVPSSVSYDVEKARAACGDLPSEWYDTCIMNSSWAFETNVGQHEDARRLCAFASKATQSRCPQ